MAKVDEYRTGDSSWYEFPDGTKVQGKDKAEEYLADLEEFDSVAEEAEVDQEEIKEAQGDDPADAKELADDPGEGDMGGPVTSDDVTDIEDTSNEELVAGKPDAKEREVVDAADGDPDGEGTDNKNVPGERDEYLIEMTRQNRSFEYAGKEKNYKFRHDARILVVDAEDVEGLRAQGGFRVVTPQEAKQYYS